jgi:tetraacyldisaccharide-1-P 4'-kinase
VGLLCALARPERVVRSLASRGIALRAVVRAPDHGPLGTKLLVQAARARIDARVDLWLATSKCALHISAATAGDAERHPHLFAPVATIEHALVLSEPMRERLRFHTLP